MKSLRTLLSLIRKANKKYNLIENGDKIAVGVSGGKDSIILLYALTLFKKYSHIDFQIVPVTMNLGFENFDINGIKSFVKKLGLDLIVTDSTNVFKILKIQKDQQKLTHLPCSICSRMKKAIINKIAKENECNKVAFAHHADDAIETLFLNEIYGGRIATFAPKMFLSNEKITFIRPLVLCSEKLIKKTLKEENLPSFKSNCPNDGITKRAEIKELIKKITTDFKGSDSNLLTMLENNEQLDLFFEHQEIKLENSNNLFYKNIINIDDYNEYLIYLNELDNNPYNNKYFEKKLKYYALYDKHQIIATLSLKQAGKDFEVISYKYNNYNDFLNFIFDLYTELYKKYNPINLYILSSKEHFLKEIGFSKVFDKKYVLNLNPIHIEKLKKN